MSASAGSFGQYLERALGLLRSESPIHFAATRDRLGPLAVTITVGDEEPVRVCLAGQPPWVLGAQRGGETAGAAGVAVSVSRSDLDAFLRGEFTIEEGLEADRLAVRGPLDHVLAFLEALSAWLHGALRCPSFPALHRSFLTGPRSTPETAN
jgi:hypothetical protein